MKLQIALDGTLSDAMAILEAAAPFASIAEIGTPLIYREGMHAVRRIREAFPNVNILADLKIMDAGYEEAAIAFDAGAKLVTVLGVTQPSTLQGAIKAAKDRNGEIVIDTMQVDDLVEQVPHLMESGADYLCIHTAFDLQASGQNPLDKLKAIRAHYPDVPLAVAGGINLGMIDALRESDAQIAIVGGAITRAENPGEAARAIHERMQAHG